MQLIACRIVDIARISRSFIPVGTPLFLMSYCHVSFPLCLLGGTHTLQDSPEGIATLDVLDGRKPALLDWK